jgi:hypothetical protein
LRTLSCAEPAHNAEGFFRHYTVLNLQTNAVQFRSIGTPKWQKSKYSYAINGYTALPGIMFCFCPRIFQSHLWWMKLEGLNYLFRAIARSFTTFSLYCILLCYMSRVVSRPWRIQCSPILSSWQPLHFVNLCKKCMSHSTTLSFRYASVGQQQVTCSRHTRGGQDMNCCIESSKWIIALFYNSTQTVFCVFLVESDLRIVVQDEFIYRVSIKFSVLFFQLLSHCLLHLYFWAGSNLGRFTSSPRWVFHIFTRALQHNTNASLHSYLPMFHANYLRIIIILWLMLHGELESCLLLSLPSP